MTRHEAGAAGEEAEGWWQRAAPSPGDCRGRWHPREARVAPGAAPGGLGAGLGSSTAQRPEGCCETSEMRSASPSCLPCPSPLLGEDQQLREVLQEDLRLRVGGCWSYPRCRVQLSGRHEPLGLVLPAWDQNLVPELCFYHSEKCVVPFSLSSFLISFSLACWKRSLQLSVLNRMFLCSYLIQIMAAHNSHAVWRAQGSACKASMSQLVPTMTFLPLEPESPAASPWFRKPGHGSVLFLPISLLWKPKPASSSGFELSHGSPISQWS